MDRRKEFKLEIVVPTYRRSACVTRMLELYQNFLSRFNNFCVSIYDSSPDDETERVVKDYISEHIYYYHISPEMDVDEKTLIALSRAESEYVMLCGDGHTVCVPTVCKIIENNPQVELFALYDSDWRVQHKYFLSLKDLQTIDRDIFMADHYWQLILYGGSVCKRCLIQRFNIGELVSHFNRLGFIYPSALAIYSRGPFMAVENKILIENSEYRESGWVEKKQLMQIWTKNFCVTVDQLSEKLSEKTCQTIVSTIGQRTAFFTVRRLIAFRKTGNFSLSLLKKFNPYFKRVKACSMVSAYLVAFCPKVLCKCIHTFYMWRKKNHSLKVKS